MRHNYVYISTIYFSMHQLLNVRLCFSPYQALGGHQIFERGLLESNDFGESLLKDKETRYNIDMKVIKTFPSKKDKRVLTLVLSVFTFLMRIFITESSLSVARLETKHIFWN